jgi:hypothetical protein
MLGREIVKGKQHLFIFVQAEAPPIWRTRKLKVE